MPKLDLQRRVLVEVVQHDLRHLAALQLDDDPHAVAVGFVAQVGDALDRLLAHQVGDPLDQLRLVDLIGNLGDDDRDCRSPFLLVSIVDRARIMIEPRPVVYACTMPPRPTMKPPVGKSGPGISRISCLSFSPRDGRRRARRSPAQVRLLDQPDAAVDDLAQVVRRDVGRHADGDAGRAVDEQVRERRRQDRRFFGGLVVVGA